MSESLVLAGPRPWWERAPACSVQDDPAAWAEHVERRLRAERRRDSVIAQEGIFVRRTLAPVVLGAAADGGLLEDAKVVRRRSADQAGG